MTSESASDGLAGLIRSYLDEGDISLRSGDRDTERHRNTWGYGFDPQVLDPTAVAEALSEVAATLSLRLGASDTPGPATFYAWYDSQAGQLMCSLASVQPDELPFGTPYRTTSKPAEITAQMAADPHPGFVLWSELHQVADEGIEEPPREPFPVWVAEVR